MLVKRTRGALLEFFDVELSIRKKMSIFVVSTSQGRFLLLVKKRENKMKKAGSSKTNGHTAGAIDWSKSTLPGNCTGIIHYRR
jgi:hypothetical protein